MSMIVVDKMTKRFGDFTAVDNVSFNVEKGEVFGFLGPNGSGKTTVIRMLTGLSTITGGRAAIDGLDLAKDVHLVRSRIGYMSQKFSLYEDLTVQENLEFYGRAYKLAPEAMRRKIADTVERNSLGPYVKRQAGRLSGGWKQRLALGCAMMHDPKVLFLDEPTAGIDPVARRQLWDLLFQLSGQGITFFVTTHYMDEAERCSHLAYLYYGHLIADGTPDSLRETPGISPPGTNRVEISTPRDVTGALRIARELPYLRSATIFGRSIHALVDEKVTRDEIAADMKDRGVFTDEVRPLVPSLEDVFVELTYIRQREMEAAHA